MVIVLIIIGASVSLFIHQPPQQVPAGCQTATQQKLVLVRTAIEHYVWTNKRYPTPASRSAGINSVLYGRETAGANIDSYTNGGNPILFGALPFETLGLPTSYAGDCWGNQFSYIVTQNLTTQAGFAVPANLGAIIMKTGRPSAPQPLIAQAAYAVISHGETGGNTGNGAVRLNNTGGHGWCVNDGTADHENCDITNAVLFASTQDNGQSGAANFFDDIVISAAKPASNCNLASTPVSWTVGAASCSSTLAGPVRSGEQRVATSVGPNTGTATYDCTNGVATLASTPAATCAVPIPTVNGSCGASNGLSLQLLPTINLCNSGLPSLVFENASIFSWTCAGTGGGTTATCSATPVCKCGGVTLICINPRNPFGGLNVLGINILC